MGVCYIDDMDKCMDSFFQYLADERNLSKNTLESYLRDIKQYISYVSNNNSDKYWREKAAVYSYLHMLQNSGRAAATIHRNLVSLRAFFQFLLKNSWIDIDPTTEFHSPKIEKKQPMVLSVEEIEAILAMPDLNSPMGIRDKAMLELLYATGLKVSELVALNVQDIDLSAGFIYCRNLGKERIVPIGKNATCALNKYIKERKKYFIRNELELAYFLNNNGQRLSRQGFWKILKKYSDSANVDKEITPHTLRHSFASHLLASGADIHAVKEMMGHSDIASTQAYKPVIKPKLKEVYIVHHPRA